MPWGKHKAFELEGEHQADAGQVSESSDTLSTIQSGPDTMYYRGYQPQRYERPLTPEVHGNAGEQGDGTVPNNTDRGNYGHGVLVDSEVWAKDHSRKDITDDVPQVMPEEEDQREYDPIKVTIVDLSPDEIIQNQTNTVTIGAVTLSAQGTPAAMGTTPIRILGKDPRRTRAYIQCISWTSGGNSANGIASLPVTLSSENQPSVYGFPLAVGAAATLVLGSRMEILSTDELWVAGQNAADAGIIAVYIERAVNSDRLRND